MRITRLLTTGVAVAERDVSTNDPTQEAVVVALETDSGLTGLAECNHASAAVRAYLEAPGASSIGVGVKELLIGQDPCARERLMADLYRGNYFSARRGLGLAVLNAIDVCLWDLVAQARGEPLWATLWGAKARAPEPYVTIYTGPGTYTQSLERMRVLLDRSRGLGYRHVKFEPLPECVPEDRIGDFLHAARIAIGTETEMFVDVAHRFSSAEDAMRSIATWIEEGPTLVETPLWVDDLTEYRRLGEVCPIAVAASELFESYWEFVHLLEVGAVDVVQPWPNRMGVTGTMRVAAKAAEMGRRCMLAGWNATPIGVAVGVHIAAGLGEGATLEHAPVETYGFPLRAIASPEPAVADGVFPLPTAPGLGVSLDWAEVEKYAV